MPLNRRRFLALAAASAASNLALSSLPAPVVSATKIKAIAFDGLAIFDPRPMFAFAEDLFPGKGAALSDAWRTRQFEYTWLRTLTGKYVDFWQVSEDALVFAAQVVNVDLKAAKRNQLVQSLLSLKAWPDALGAIQSLKESGLRMALLSNFTPAMLDAAVRNSSLQGVFEPHLSTDKVRAYKPDARAYQMAIDAFGLKREEIAFVAFGGWDAAGAKAFGYPTFWVNRMSLPLEELGSAPDGTSTTLHDLLTFVNRDRGVASA
jgi:2-haloacid dehalogenase